MASFDEGGLIDATAMLGCGVYVLWWRGQVKKIAWAKSVLARVATHRRLCNEHVPSWMPIKGIKFDRVVFWPCAEDRSDEVIEAIKGILGYDRAKAA